MAEFLTDADARTLYAAGDAAHDFDHVLRVARLAVELAQAEGADVEVVRVAALLHDLPADDEDAEETVQGEEARASHHHSAAERAVALLAAWPLSAEQIANVAHCIRSHRFRDRSEPPQSLEARCLYDADKLDSMGAIGVARAIAFAAHHGNRLWSEPVAAIERGLAAGRALPVGEEYSPTHEFVFKLQRLHGTLHTARAREMGRTRHATMVAYFAALDAELTPLSGQSD
jgi:uncharacterized protein